MLNKLPLLVLLLAGTSASAESPNNGLCSGLEGAALGLCTAASRIGCGTDVEKNSKACAKIEENYFQTTGKLPPWLAVCPCWTAEELAGLRFPTLPPPEGEFVFCLKDYSYENPIETVLNVDIFSIDKSDSQGNLFYSTLVQAVEFNTFNAGSACALTDLCTIGTCLQVNGSQNISLEEFAICEAQLNQAAVDRGISCFVE